MIKDKKLSEVIEHLDYQMEILNSLIIPREERIYKLTLCQRKPYFEMVTYTRICTGYRGFVKLANDLCRKTGMDIYKFHKFNYEKEIKK